MLHISVLNKCIKYQLVTVIQVMYTSKNQENNSFLLWIVSSLEYLSHLSLKKRIVVATTIRGNTVCRMINICLTKCVYYLIIGHRVFVEASGCQSTTFSQKFIKNFFYKLYFLQFNKNTELKFFRQKYDKIRVSKNGNKTKINIRLTKCVYYLMIGYRVDLLQSL